MAAFLLKLAIFGGGFVVGVLAGRSKNSFIAYLVSEAIEFVASKFRRPRK
jgi:hypothetical protein